MATTLLVSHPACSGHDTGQDHADTPARVSALLAAVRADAELGLSLIEETGIPALEEDLLRVHAPEQVTQVRKTCEQAQLQQGLIWLDADTPVSAGSWEAALAAAGTVITAAEAVIDGRANTSFALSRPPGHHATRHQSMGFCIFDNVAVAIRRLQASGRIERALVVDWDAHHGNGSQEIFYADPSVFVLSLHLSPDYPGTGGAEERGDGPGHGTTLNVPLPHGTTASQYRRHFLDALDSAFAVFKPDLVVVSAGFDCLAGDPEGGFLLEPVDLHLLTRELIDRTPTDARVIGALEGGYVVERIGGGLVNMMRAFAGLPGALPPKIGLPSERSRKTRRRIKM